MALFTITFCIWTNYLYDGDEYKFNFSFVLFNLIYILLYFGCGTYLFESGVSVINKYSSYEVNAWDASYLNNLKREFENQFYDQSFKNKINKDKLSYLIMRQNFISPVGIPILKEMYLRGDFDLSFYLGYCLSDFLSEFIFSIDTFYYFLSVVITAGFYFGSDTKTWSLCLFVWWLLLILGLSLFNMHLQSVLKIITPKLESPQDLNLEVNMDSRDPFHNNWIIPLFEYQEFEKSIEEEKIEPVEEYNEQRGSESDGIISKGSLELNFDNEDINK